MDCFLVTSGSVLVMESAGQCPNSKWLHMQHLEFPQIYPNFFFKPKSCPTVRRVKNVLEKVTSAKIAEGHYGQVFADIRFSASDGKCRNSKQSHVLCLKFLKFIPTAFFFQTKSTVRHSRKILEIITLTNIAEGQ